MAKFYKKKSKIKIVTSRDLPESIDQEPTVVFDESGKKIAITKMVIRFQLRDINNDLLGEVQDVSQLYSLINQSADKLLKVAKKKNKFKTIKRWFTFPKKEIPNPFDLEK